MEAIHKKREVGIKSRFKLVKEDKQKMFIGNIFAFHASPKNIVLFMNIDVFSACGVCGAAGNLVWPDRAKY